VANEEPKSVMAKGVHSSDYVGMATGRYCLIHSLSSISIFSWVSTLLVGITGGVIALNGKDFSFTALHKIALTFAVILLSTFSSIRIYNDSTVALAYSKVIYKLDAE
jgi:hypothetical protein